VATWKSTIENLPLVVVARTCAALLRRLFGRGPDLLDAWIEAAAAAARRRRVQIGRSRVSATIDATAAPRVRSLAPLAHSMRTQ
jgi:hypothetical protein